MNKKQIIFGALLGLPSLANADVTFSLSDLTIAAGETKTVTVNIDVTDASELSTYQMNIELPTGLYFKDLDHVSTQTDYEWQLNRYSKETKNYDGKEHTTKMQFIGMNFSGDESLKLTKDSKTKVAFTFDVVAASNFDPEDGAVKDIIVDEVKATDADYKTPVDPVQRDKYEVAGATEDVRANITAQNGKAVGEYELNDEYNWVVLRNEALEENISLTATKSYKVTFGLHNPSVLNALGIEQNPKGIKIRGIEGDVILPKGIVFDGNIKSVSKRTTGELLKFGDVQDIKNAAGEKVGEKRHFIVLSTEANIRNFAEYKDSLFTFNVKANGTEGENAFVEESAKIEITNFELDVNDGGKHTWTLDTDNGKNDLFIYITNPDKAAKDQKDDEIGDTSTDGTVWGNYQAAINAENDSVKNCVALKDPTTGAEALASKAISDYAAEVLKQYQNGDLATWAGTEADLALQKAANDAIANITTVNNDQLAIARQKAKAANDAISATEPEIPTYLDQETAIKDIKDQRKGNSGTLKNAKDALGKYNGETLESGQLYDAIAAGTLSDADFTAAIDAITGAEGEIAKLNAAIEAAKTAKAANDEKAKAALALKPAELADNVKQDDTAGTYAAAVALVNEAQKNLTTAYGKNGEDGTVGVDGKAADPDVYKTLIDAVQTAIDGIAPAIEAVNAKAKENNDAAQAAIDAPIPVIIPNANKDDAEEDGTFAKATKAYNDALQAINTAIETAATEGTQAKDDIYKAEIEAIEAAIAGLEAANTTLQKEADDNAALVTEALKAEPNAIPGEVAANENVTGKKAAFDKAKTNLEEAVDKAFDAGTQARPGVYNEVIEAYNKAIEELNAAIDAAAKDAAKNEQAVINLEKDAKKPAGTEAAQFLDAYDEIKGSQDIKDLENALDEAKTALAEALQNSKDNGLLADNQYLDGEGNKKSLDDAKQAVTDAVAALQAEYDKQSDQAAKNVEAINAQQMDMANESLLYGNLDDDVKDASIVEEYLAVDDEFNASGKLYDASQAVQQQVEKMMNEDLMGDADETEELNKLLKAYEDTKAEFEQAVQDAQDALKDIADMTADVDDLKESFTDTTDDEVLSELEKAKVANPAEQEQEKGKLPTTQAQYYNLVATLNGYADAVQAKVDEVKAKFLAGTMTKDEVNTWMKDELPVLTENAKENTVNTLVEYLMTVQRGDVGGDDRWTSNDYALIRKMILDETYPAAEAVKTDGVVTGYKGDNSEDVYALARYDINQDGLVNVGDAQGALNYAYYGSWLGQNAARSNSNVAESLNAEMVGNRIAVSLTNSRQYSALQMDVVLPEGMTIESQSVADRNDGFSIAASQLKNGATRIVVTANEAGKAFAGNEGDVLYIDVNGQGTVSFENIIFADVNAGTKQFQLASVTGGIATGIAAAKSENGMMETIYNMGGRLMNGLKKGINIIRRADGTTEKVIKK